MAVQLLGFAIAQLGLRAIPVMLRTGQMAMRYFVATPGTKGKAMQELAKRVLGKNAIVDDVAKLTSKSKDNTVGKILLETNPKAAGYNKMLPSVSAKEKEQLMQIAYRDSSKLLQSQKSYPLTAKLAGDIEAGVGQSFSKEASGRLFIAGDRAKIAFKEGIEKATVTPKALPRPTKEAIGPYYTPPVTPLEVAKSGVGTAQTTPGLTALQRGAFRTLERAKTGKKTIPLRVKDQKGKVTLTQAKEIVKKQQGIEKEIIGGKEVIAEGLRGVGSTPKPPWWQATIPPFLRTGKGVWNPYKGAYPPQVSALRVGGTGAGIGLLAYNFPRAGDILEAQKEKENILSPEDILKTEMDKWAAAFNPEAITEEVDISLPERIE